MGIFQQIRKKTEEAFLLVDDHFSMDETGFKSNCTLPEPKVSFLLVSGQWAAAFRVKSDRGGQKKFRA
jgi:hypothetical protein